MKTKGTVYQTGLAVVSAIFLSSCLAMTGVQRSEPVTITHEHRVETPVAIHTPSSFTPVFLSEKGQMSISVDYNHSGKNTNDDPNITGTPSTNQNTISHQKIHQVNTWSVNSSYALTDTWSLSGSFNFGNDREMYTPYIESWQLYDVEYEGFYWWWIGDLHATGPVRGSYQQVDGYQKVTYDLERMYNYKTADIAIARQFKSGNFNTQILGGVGVGQHTTRGHLPLSNRGSFYGNHRIHNFQYFIQPAIAYSKTYFEAGIFTRLSHLYSDVQSDNPMLTQPRIRTYNNFFMEPGAFLRIGPEQFRFNLEYKWLTTLNKTNLHFNSSYVSVGVISLFNTRS